MSQRYLCKFISCAAVAAVSSFAFAGGTGNGPDVIVSTIGSALTKNGTVGTITGYSMTTVSCNLGEAEAIWIDTGGQPWRHPVIGQQMYRLKDGKFEQIGMSWLKHGFCAADAPSCGAPYEPNGSCDWLGTFATDTYDASLNGSQPGLGPRSEIQPFTGVYPYPYLLGWSASGNAIYKRLQIENNDLNPAMNAGATYFAESVYITTDEAVVNRSNNESYRQVTVGALSGGGYILSFTGGTIQQKAAIQRWKVADPTVHETEIIVPGEGRFILSSKVKSLGGGEWNYEFALYNSNSDRAGQSFTVDLPAGATATNLGFHDVNYHSGEPYSLTDWPGVVGANNVSWATQTFAENVNANALRWNTLYNFRFNSNRPPKLGQATIGLFKTGSPNSVSGSAFVPDYDCNGNNVADTQDISGGTSLDANTNGIPDECEVPPTCAPDLTGNGIVDVDDLLTVINSWGVKGGAGDVTGNGIVDVDDLLAVINAWGPCL
jgi:hypothetical protein